MTLTAQVNDLARDRHSSTHPQAHPPTVDVAVVIDRRGAPLQVATGTLPVERDEPNGRGCGFNYVASGRVVGRRVVAR